MSSQQVCDESYQKLKRKKAVIRNCPVRRWSDWHVSTNCLSHQDATNYETRQPLAAINLHSKIRGGRQRSTPSVRDEEWVWSRPPLSKITNDVQPFESAPSSSNTIHKKIIELRQKMEQERVQVIERCRFKIYEHCRKAYFAARVTRLLGSLASEECIMLSVQKDISHLSSSDLELLNHNFVHSLWPDSPLLRRQIDNPVRQDQKQQQQQPDLTVSEAVGLTTPTAHLSDNWGWSGQRFTRHDWGWSGQRFTRHAHRYVSEVLQHQRAPFTLVKTAVNWQEHALKYLRFVRQCHINWWSRSAELVGGMSPNFLSTSDLPTQGRGRHADPQSECHTCDDLSVPSLNASSPVVSNVRRGYIKAHPYYPRRLKKTPFTQSARQVTLPWLLFYFSYNNYSREWQMVLQVMMDQKQMPLSPSLIKKCLPARAHRQTSGSGSTTWNMAEQLFQHRVSIVSHHKYLMFSDNVDLNQAKFKQYVI